MTGYGKAEAAAADKKITVEIRSLNSKQLDMSVRLPGAYRPYEYDIRTRVAHAVQRGKVDLFVSVEAGASAAAAAIDQALFAAYRSRLAAILQQQGLGAGPFEAPVEAALLQSILRLPEVVSSENASIPEAEQQALMQAVDGAVEALQAFRTQEGATLLADLLRRVERIEALRLQIVPLEKARIPAIRARILDHIASLGIEADHNRLEQEMIYYIEKLDITEEKVRLKNHCDYFRSVASSEDGVGRKLGFIAQEMGREINTLGSKANDSEIQRAVVQMKDELEKIKEQVLNIL